jgi:hypothetical protein
MSDELKPCPFCGGSTWCIQTIGHPAQSCHIHCQECGAQGAPSCAGMTGSGMVSDQSVFFGEAGKLWNTRATEDALRKQLAEAVARIKSVQEYISARHLGQNAENIFMLNEIFLDRVKGGK